MAAVTPALAEQLVTELDADLEREGRLGKVRRYLKGDHDLPYIPKGAKGEFTHLARRAVTNWTPLLPDTFAKGLFVDGYRAAKAADDSAAWAFWQANGLDARQSIAHRGALDYGVSYTLVLPGSLGEKRVPVIRPLSPLKSAAWYRDDEDEYPELGLRLKGQLVDGTRLVELYDRASRYTFALPKDASRWVLSKTEEHGLGVTPFVRFRDRLDDEAVGVVRPILTLQDRVNEVVFATLIAMQYASFRQRWATGLAIPFEEVLGADGKPTGEEQPVEPFEAAVNRLWVSEDSETKFGDFAQTELSGHLGLYEATVKTLAAISQVSPTVLTGDLVNVSAEGLAALNDSTERRIGEYGTLFGESWESVFRLGSSAAGDRDGALDTSSQVRWRDMSVRSLAQTTDALGKLAQMLSVPVEALWERIPGVSQQDVDRWKSMRDQDPLSALTAELTRQSAGAADKLAATPDTPDANADTGAAAA